MSAIKRVSYTERNVFVVPVADFNFNQYVHIDLDPVELTRPRLPLKKLTPVELNVLKFLMRDMTVPAVADEMNISERRVLMIIATLRKALGARTNHGLMAKLYQMGFSAHVLY